MTTGLLYVTRGIAAGDSEQIKGPSFEWHSLFPLRDLMGFKQSTLIVGDEVLVTMGFKQSDDAPDQCQPTRVEVLSAFLRKCFLDIDQVKNKGSALPKVYLATHIVNVKSRMVPSLPTNSFGNVLGVSAASIVMNNTGDEENDQYNYPKLVGEVRDSIKKVDADYVKLSQTTDAQLIAFEAMIQASTSGQAVMLNFSSWCRFPLYDADFGWGKPTWVSTAALAMKNMVVLMDTSSGDGIEAWVHLSTKDMAEFERHEELLASILN